jgi:hypothetical protein
MLLFDQNLSLPLHVHNILIPESYPIFFFNQDHSKINLTKYIFGQ